MSAAETITPPFAPSIRLGVPWEEYRALPGVTITRLKELARSPKHYRYRLDHPKQSGAMTLGTAAHVATLEPHRFERDFVVWGREEGENVRRGKVWEAFAERHKDRSILTVEEHRSACAIRDAVRAHPPAAKYLERGEAEVTMRWIARGGSMCKGRIDWLTIDPDAGGPVILGLKTARDASPDAFGKQAARLGYVSQWSFYADAYAEITGGEVPRVVEIVVESTPPHDVAVYFVPDDVLDQGRDDYSKFLATLDRCEERGEWPGAVEAEAPVVLPRWAYADAENDGFEMEIESE